MGSGGPGINDSFCAAAMSCWPAARRTGCPRIGARSASPRGATTSSVPTTRQGPWTCVACPDVAHVNVNATCLHALATELAACFSGSGDEVLTPAPSARESCCCHHNPGVWTHECFTQAFCHFHGDTCVDESNCNGGCNAGGGSGNGGTPFSSGGSGFSSGSGFPVGSDGSNVCMMMGSGLCNDPRGMPTSGGHRCLDCWHCDANDHLLNTCPRDAVGHLRRQGDFSKKLGVHTAGAAAPRTRKRLLPPQPRRLDAGVLCPGVLPFPWRHLRG